ncbi:hypothetical protein LCGC14_1181720 [marine sediment metagenome]|uniref:Uncharacterized protein n=1 Tax=marine sediment metagenome TaxID=412755 RepID=A0A0F9P4S0_9ZZZZ
MFRYTLLLERGSEEEFAQGQQVVVLAAALARHLVTPHDDAQREPDENALHTYREDLAIEIFGELTEGDVR